MEQNRVHFDKNIKLEKEFINIYESIEDKEQLVEHKFFCIKRNLIK